MNSTLTILDCGIKRSRAVVEIKSQNPSDLGIVIGKHGCTLDSLQYLCKLLINTKKIS